VGHGTVSRLASNTTLSAPRVSATRWSVRLTGVVGWVLVGCGVGVLLYLAYALLFTNIGAGRAQSQLREQWQQVEAAPRGQADHPDAAPATRDVPGVALIQFVRPGRTRPLIHDEPLVVLDDVTSDALAKGPGHYPDTALPGEPGNFSVAGHRTTHGAPFFHLNQVRQGDQILVTDRDGTRYTYEVSRQQVVLPSDTWVIAADPLGTGEPTMTLTTCNPRFSAAQRLVVHAELVS
jgi:sortase A